MAFEQAGAFIFQATKKYKLHKQVVSGIILTNVKKLIKNDYQDYVNFWKPKKIENAKLFIYTSNSAASSALFMSTHEIMEKINKIDLPLKIKEIIIQKNK